MSLAALGVFAVVSFLAAARKHEMGVRLAMGATPSSLVASTVRHALRPIVAGAALGVLGARWIGEAMEAHLYGVEARDPVVLVVAVAGVVLAASVQRTCQPAARAAWTRSKSCARRSRARATP